MSLRKQHVASPKSPTSVVKLLVATIEAEARVKAKKVANAYRNGESRHYVEWIRYSGWKQIMPETFVCKTCGQTINYQEMKKDYRAGFTGTFPENPYEDRMWVEFYTKDNQP